MENVLPLNKNNTSYIIIRDNDCTSKILYNDDIISVDFSIHDIDNFISKELLRIIQYYKSTNSHPQYFRINFGEVFDTKLDIIIPRTTVYSKLSQMLTHKSVNLELRSKDYEVSFLIATDKFSYSPINSLRYDQLLLRINGTSEYLVLD